MPDPGHCQGYALKNWVEGLSDEAYYPWESPKKFDLNWSTLHLQQTKESFGSWIKSNLGVF